MTVMTSPDATAVHLSKSDLALLIESLESHEYWQLGDTLPRNDGCVFVPGDTEPDRFWEDTEPSPDQQAAIDEIRRCRRLAEDLGAVLGHAPRG